MKEFFRKKSVIIFIIVIIVIIVGTFGVNYLMDRKSGKLVAKENQQEIKSINEEMSQEESKELKSADYYPEADVYDIIHRMANTKIIAENNKIWGELPMKPEEIQNLKGIVEKVNYEDREQLLEILNRWETGDFSQADKDHNYVWEKLGGTIGKAVGIKK
jgi:preprotein translocase subunit SecF